MPRRQSSFTTIKKPIKGKKWAEDEPIGKQRIVLFKMCPKCILVPPKKTQDKTDPKNYKFPICTKPSTSKTCELNCTGVLAANRRARLTKKYPDVEKLTGKLLDEFKCTKASIQKDKKKLEEKTQPPKPKKTQPPKLKKTQPIKQNKKK